MMSWFICLLYSFSLPFYKLVCSDNGANHYIRYNNVFMPLTSLESKQENRKKSNETEYKSTLYSIMLKYKNVR